MLEKDLNPVPNWLECALASVNACKVMSSMASLRDGAENTCVPEEHACDPSNLGHEWRKTLCPRLLSCLQRSAPGGVVTGCDWDAGIVVAVSSVLYFAVGTRIALSRSIVLDNQALKHVNSAWCYNRSRSRIYLLCDCIVTMPYIINFLNVLFLCEYYNTVPQHRMSTFPAQSDYDMTNRNH